MVDKATRRVRHNRIRTRITGTPERPRMNVYRSLKNIYVQIIDDLAGHTLVSASTQDPAIKEEITNGGNKEAARKVGELVAERALENDITRVVFDRGGYKYHGRVRELAEAAREKGLNF
ncbi:MAG: 50S ribosomal protein L18 [Halanaerobiales bacterium]